LTSAAWLTSASLSHSAGVGPAAACQACGAPPRAAPPRACPLRHGTPPPPPSRTNWTRLVPRPVLTGHVSSSFLPPPASRLLAPALYDMARPRPAPRASPPRAPWVFTTHLFRETLRFMNRRGLARYASPTAGHVTPHQPRHLRGVPGRRAGHRHHHRARPRPAPRPGAPPQECETLRFQKTPRSLSARMREAPLEKRLQARYARGEGPKGAADKTPFEPFSPADSQRLRARVLRRPLLRSPSPPSSY